MPGLATSPWANLFTQLTDHKSYTMGARMPRKRRIHLPGGLYHAVARGNNKQDIFFNQSDRRSLEELAAEAAKRYCCRIHAYCWMSNHIHLAVQVAERPLGRFMQFLLSQYAKKINWQLDRTGHLFERRHRAILVDTDEYLLGLVRYIHLNPVEAGLVADPAEYPWSSHRAYLSKAAKSWLTTEWVLSMFAATEGSAIHQFARFVGDGSSDTDKENFEAGTKADERVLGDDNFIARLQPEPGFHRSSMDLITLIRTYCEHCGVEPSVLASPDRRRRYAKIRARIACEAMRSGIATLADVARKFNRSDSVLCRAVRRYCRDRS